jgi:hypothetical protein
MSTLLENLSSAPTAENAPGFDLVRKTGGRYDVSLQGRFLPGWLGNFSSALAGYHLSILAGSARRVSAFFWNARFEIDAGVAATAPEEIDFLALAAARFDSPVTSPALQAARVTEEGEALLVEVEGGDQIGFLAGLLKRFAFYSLFPVELDVATHDGVIADRIRLKGMGGLRPSAQAAAALRRGLQELVENTGLKGPGKIIFSSSP